MERIKLTKMQGLGNDFVIIDFAEYEKSGMQMPELAKKVCDRHFGIGADGMIIPNLAPKDKNADIGWYFYNSDGTTAQMCGNGIRCFAKYAYDKKLVSSKEFAIETLAGIIVPAIQENGKIKVNMSSPKGKIEKETIQVNSESFEINIVSMGNPHCIIFVEDDSDLLDLAETYGPKIENHTRFPEKTNVEFVRVLSKSEMDLRVYERGCGITLACGTGACAATVAAILNNLTENNVKVNLLGGALTIDWQGSQDDLNKDVFMTGPAEYSFFAEYIL